MVVVVGKQLLVFIVNEASLPAPAATAAGVHTQPPILLLRSAHGDKHENNGGISTPLKYATKNVKHVCLVACRFFSQAASLDFCGVIKW